MKMRYDDAVSIHECYAEEYQRPLRMAFVRKGAKDWDEILAQCCLLAKTSRGYAILDGQHRIEMRRLSGGQTIRALIIEGLTKPQRAMYFVESQMRRRAMTPIERFKAKLIAKNKDTLALNAAVEAAGFVVGKGKRSGGNMIQAIASLEEIYAWRSDIPGAEVVKRTLRIIDCFPSDVDHRTDADILKGIAWVIARHPDVDDEVLATAIMNRGLPSTLLGWAKDNAPKVSSRGGRALTRGVTIQTVVAYNKRVEKGSRLPVPEFQGAAKLKLVA
jgi:hypothetical protein